MIQKHKEKTFAVLLLGLAAKWVEKFDISNLAHTLHLQTCDHIVLDPPISSKNIHFSP